MEFTPKIKRKRRCPKVNNSVPFPTETGEKPKAVFNGFSVEMIGNEDEPSLESLHKNGCFGKGSHSRSNPQPSASTSNDKRTAVFKETLVLDLEEAFFLAFELNAIEIADIQGNQLIRDQVFDKFVRIKPNFTHTLVAYIYLKSKGWIVKSGTKFGGHFLIYKEGMQFYHASFVVLVSEEDASMEPKDLQGRYRVAETSNKDLLFLNVYAPDQIDKSDYHKHLNAFKVAEIIPRRLDLKKHVQSKQKTK